MKKKYGDKFKAVEDEMYSLIAEINYGDTSSLDVYWTSLSNALTDLEVKGWDAESVRDQPVSEILSSIPSRFIPNGLIELISQMEGLSSGGSSDSMAQAYLEELQGLTFDFETLFSELLTNLRNKNGNE